MRSRIEVTADCALPQGCALSTGALAGGVFGHGCALTPGEAFEMSKSAAVITAASSIAQVCCDERFGCVCKSNFAPLQREKSLTKSGGVGDACATALGEGTEGAATFAICNSTS